MSKRKINTKLQVSYTEMLLVNLKQASISKETAPDKKQAIDSLLRWYLANHFFTPAQLKLAKSLVTKKQTKPVAIKKHYVYAISDGDNIKIGMSNNVPARLKALQTSNSKELIVVWKYYVGNTAKDAIKIERMLHRACRKYLIRGEWFSMDCIDIINSFNPNKKHCAKWEYAKLITVKNKRKNGVLDYSVSDIRRNNVSHSMNRVWAQSEVKELYQKEIKTLLDDLHVVLVEHE
jgi:hypothetical protein